MCSDKFHILSCAREVDAGCPRAAKRSVGVALFWVGDGGFGGNDFGEILIPINWDAVNRSNGEAFTFSGVS